MSWPGGVEFWTVGGCWWSNWSNSNNRTERILKIGACFLPPETFTSGKYILCFDQTKVGLLDTSSWYSWEIRGEEELKFRQVSFILNGASSPENVAWLVLILSLIDLSTGRTTLIPKGVNNQQQPAILKFKLERYLWWWKCRIYLDICIKLLNIPSSYIYLYHRFTLDPKNKMQSKKITPKIKLKICVTSISFPGCICWQPWKPLGVDPGPTCTEKVLSSQALHPKVGRPCR